MTSDPHQAMQRIGPDPTTRAPQAHFTGDAWVNTITPAVLPGSAHLAAVTFAPGAHTAWHRHAHGQTLHVTSGWGIVSTRDGQVIHLRPGDTVYTPPGVWHWHGAMPTTSMTHLALSDASAEPDAVDVEWADHVLDADYTTATSAQD